MKTLSFEKSVKNNLVSQNEAKELRAAVANSNNIVISGNYNNGQARLLLEVVKEVNNNDASTQLLLVEDHWGSLVEFFDENEIENVKEFGVKKVLNELKSLKEDKSCNYVFVFDSIFRKPELIYPMIDVIQEGFQVIFLMNSETEDFKSTLENKLGKAKTNLITGSELRDMSHVYVALPEETM